MQPRAPAPAWMLSGCEEVHTVVQARCSCGLWLLSMLARKQIGCRPCSCRPACPGRPRRHDLNAQLVSNKLVGNVLLWGTRTVWEAGSARSRVLWPGKAQHGRHCTSVCQARTCLGAICRQGMLPPARLLLQASCAHLSVVHHKKRGPAASSCAQHLDHLRRASEPFCQQVHVPAGVLGHADVGEQGLHVQPHGLGEGGCYHHETGAWLHRLLQRPGLQATPHASAAWPERAGADKGATGRCAFVEAQMGACAYA